MTTAAQTIIPAIAAALGASFAFGAGAYRARVAGAYVSIRRAAPGSTVAEIHVDADGRSEEQRITIRIAEALRAAGFAPSRNTYTVRLDWNAVRAAA